MIIEIYFMFSFVFDFIGKESWYQDINVLSQSKNPMQTPRACNMLTFVHIWYRGFKCFFSLNINHNFGGTRLLF